jgi:hypothetical protein
MAKKAVKKKAAKHPKHSTRTFYLSSHSILAAIGAELKEVQKIIELASRQPHHIKKMNVKIHGSAKAKLKKLHTLQRMVALDYCCDQQAQNCQYDVNTGDGGDNGDGGTGGNG